MYDRALQALVKLALEPEWEAKFEPNSYGFRPGRSALDAIEAIFISLHIQAKYVLDADIAKCFDRINHKALLDKIGTFPLLRRVIQAWLEAGVLDGGTLFPTEEGTPQGGVISPLLANIALHGLEEAVTSQFPKVKLVDGVKREWKPTVIRYADDFVICHPNLEVIQKCQAIVQEWLKGMSLEMKPSKTKIVHTLVPCSLHDTNSTLCQKGEDKEVGFNFLGFHIRQVPVGKCKSGKDGKRNPLGFKTLIRPSKEKIKLHNHRIGEVVRQYKNAPQAALIRRLNPIIRGWCNYYRSVESSKVFQKLDEVTHQILYRWAKRRHLRKGHGWVVRKYWQFPQWVFGPKDGPTLRRHSSVKIRRHIKVRGDKSPYDGDWAYWSARRGHHPGVTLWLAMLLRKQQGKCAYCGHCFMPDDLLEVHHRDGEHSNNKRGNLEVLHRHCHDSVHGPKKTVETTESAHEKGWSVEEPDEGKSLTSGFEDQYEG
jgi:RNA-directed DNA polymerase